VSTSGAEVRRFLSGLDALQNSHGECRMRKREEAMSALEDKNRFE
jgi:hypothetical protein